MTTTQAPTIVLVHGAFADASSWAGVIKRLQAGGHAVQAVANPLRGLAADGEYVASIARQIDGPVLLVGHSYGGPVITHAGTKADNVVALVFVASFGLDQGQTIPESTAAFPPPELSGALRPQMYPVGDGEAPELYIEATKFASVFAADVNAEQLAILAVSQRPVSAPGFVEPLAVAPAWKNLPSWFLVAALDNAINPDSQRAAAQRLGSTVLEVAASHAVAVSQPDAVASLIVDALEAVTREVPVRPHGTRDVLAP
jgi:pimeloyl-ACP methyl ester carboxylesterase